MYEILFERNVERDLKSLPKGMFENQKPQGSRKIIGSKNDRRIRVADYRGLYEIHEEVKAVKVMRIRHRREAYR